MKITPINPTSREMQQDHAERRKVFQDLVELKVKEGKTFEEALKEAQGILV